MSKKITIWSTKGGVGKTSICAELHFRLGYPVVTNEQRSMLRFLVDEKYLKLLQPKEKIANYKSSMLFDFGGYIDGRIVDAVKQSDIVIIPTTPDIPDLQGCLDSINALKEYNNNIIIVANRIVNFKSFDDIRNELQVKNKIIPINQSKAFPSIYKKKKGIIEMTKNNPLLKYSYRKVINQIDVLMKVCIDESM